MKALVAVPRSFLRFFRLFRGQTGNRIFLLILLTLLMSYSEVVGIALFFPLLTIGQGGQDSLSAFLGPALQFLHISPTPLGVLPFIVAAFVLKGALQFCTTAYQFYLHSELTRRLRRLIILGFCAVDYKAVIGANTGHYSNLLVNVVDRFGDAFVSFVRTIPPMVNVVVFFGIVLLFDWRLTLVFGVLGLGSVAFVQVAGRILAQYSRVGVKEHAALASLLIQMVQAFKYLRTRGGFTMIQPKIDSSADRLAHAQYRTAIANALTQSISQPLAVIIVAAVVFYLIGIRGEQLGSLLILLAYFFRMIGDLWQIQVNWQAFYSNVGSVDLIQEDLAYLEKNSERGGMTAYPGFKHRLSLHNLSFGYLDNQPVLHDINLEIGRNAMVAFVGESGSGKSTLVDLITGTLKPSAGRVTVDGLSLSELDMETMRTRIGYVPQDGALFDDTVASNITLWKSGCEAEMREAARQAQCLDFIEAMPNKFDTQIGDRGAKLSGGQRQRIAIARELFRRPEILILDEATSSLDSESERAIQKSIDSLKGRVTILIIAHRLSTVRGCDCIYVLEAGRIIESGTFDELISSAGSKFRRMCQLQNMG